VSAVVIRRSGRLDAEPPDLYAQDPHQHGVAIGADRRLGRVVCLRLVTGSDAAERRARRGPCDDSPASRGSCRGAGRRGATAVWSLPSLLVDAMSVTSQDWCGAVRRG
jgi:hypothetical protein